MAQLPISAEDAEKEIKAQIAEKGLNVITSKMIRKHLEAKFNCPLDVFKEEIDTVIASCICGINVDVVDKQSSESCTSATSDFDVSLTNANANDARKRKVAAPDNGAKRRAETPDESEEDDLATAVKRRRSANQPMPKKRVGGHKAKEKNVEKKGAAGNRKRTSAFSRICVIATELSSLLGKHYMRRSDVVKEMWAYFRTNNLLDPTNKQFVILDEPLKRVFGQKSRIKAFGMMSELKKYVKDVALLDDAARARAEADIAQILAKEEAANDLDKDEDDDDEKLEAAANHSAVNDISTPTSSSTAAVPTNCAAVVAAIPIIGEAVQPPALTTAAHANDGTVMPQHLGGKEDAAAASDDSSGDTGCESQESDESDSDSDA